MKRICLFLIAFTLLLAGCNSNKVKVRGKVIGLQGTVKLLAEMPGQQGLVILAQQDVTDGNIDLETEALQIPARVWVDVAGKNKLLERGTGRAALKTILACLQFVKAIFSFI